MLRRKAMDLLEQWKADPSHRALLVDGARQVGKTYLIREFGRRAYANLAEVNLLETEGAARAFSTAVTSDDLFSRITLYANGQVVPHETLIFVDEVQEAPEMITAAKFLVERMGDQYDFVFSGSLLGVELKNVRSWPVGYMRTITMHPLDFEEWCWANGMGETLLKTVDGLVARREPVDPFVHERLMQLFRYYLAVGGMPQAVQAYVDSKNLQEVRRIQGGIVEYYRNDITRYCDPRDALFVKRVFDLIPAQLNQQNKRFVATSVGRDVRVGRDENRFVWLEEAGVAIAVYNVAEPRYPLMLSEESTLFKLFMCDVGLLAHESGMETVRGVIGGESVNYGAIYENFVAQELCARGRRTWYYRSKKLGELDFVIDWPSGRVLPIEVKSGKDYRRHRALTNVLEVGEWGLREAVVLHDGNVETDGAVAYLPIYAAAQLAESS